MLWKKVFINFYWSIVALQCCVSFCYTVISFFFFSFLKSLLNLLQYYICFLFWFFWPQGMWDLSSLTRDQTCTPCIIRRQSLNHWTTREISHLFSCIEKLSGSNGWRINEIFDGTSLLEMIESQMTALADYSFQLHTWLLGVILLFFFFLFFF